MALGLVGQISEMKKILFLALNIAIIAVFGWFWLVFIFLYLVWKNSQKSTSVKNDRTLADLKESQTTAPQPLLSPEAIESIKKNKVVIGTILAIAVVGIGSVKVGGNFIADRKSEAIFKEAEQLLADNRFSEAISKVDEATKVNPGDLNKAQELKVRASNLKNSLQLLEDSQKSISENRYLDAANSLGRINTNERELEDQAKAKLKELESKVVQELKSSIASLKAKSQFEEAVKRINTFSIAYPSNKSFEGERKQLEELGIQQAESRKRVLFSALRKSYDEFEDITWYESKLSPRYRDANAFYVYFGVSDNSKLPLRLVVQYYSSDWLFIQSAQINVDGQIWDLNISDWERDNDSNIWEWSDEVLEDRSLIEAIIKSKSAVIRFDGRQYFDKRTINSSQKLALKQILNAYDAY